VDWEIFFSTLIAGLVSGTVIATVLTLATSRWVAEVKATVQDEADRITETRTLEWELLRQVLGPVVANQRRTGLAFKRWREKNVLLETLIIAESNRRVRDILLDNFHLLTPDLRKPASELIEHYDLWLEAYERERKSQKPEEAQSAFTFVGPAGYPFPHDAETAFAEALDRTYERLMAVERPGASSTRIRQAAPGSPSP
jgi:hypothetical protein